MGQITRVRHESLRRKRVYASRVEPAWRVKNITEKKRHETLDESFGVTYRLRMTNANALLSDTNNDVFLRGFRVGAERGAAACLAEKAAGAAGSDLAFTEIEAAAYDTRVAWLLSGTGDAAAYTAGVEIGHVVGWSVEAERGRCG